MSIGRVVAGLAATLLAVSAAVVPAPAQGGKGATVQLRMSLEEGQSYRMKMVMEQQIEQTLMGSALEVTQSTETVQRFDVREVDADGVARVTWVHESVRFSQDGPAGHIEYDSSDTMRTVTPMTMGYDAMVGKELSARISPVGVVSEVQGMDEIVDVILSDLDSPTAEGLRESLRDQLGNEAMAELLSSTFGIFPTEPVSVGDSWERTIEITVIFPMVIEAMWTLRERRDGIAVIDVESTLTSDPDAPPLEMGDFSLKVDLSGAQTGTIELDESTGWILRGEVRQELAGESSMTGVPELQESWPMKISGTITTEAL